MANSPKTFLKHAAKGVQKKEELRKEIRKNNIYFSGKY